MEPKSSNQSLQTTSPTLTINQQTHLLLQSGLSSIHSLTGTYLLSNNLSKLPSSHLPVTYMFHLLLELLMMELRPLMLHLLLFPNGTDLLFRVITLSSTFGRTQIKVARLLLLSQEIWQLYHNNVYYRTLLIRKATQLQCRLTLIQLSSHSGKYFSLNQK